MFDILVKGGSIVDGTGGAPFSGDVGIRDGRIAEVGRIDGHAHRTIDADGALVTPGFIDLHSHYEGQLTWDDRLDHRSPTASPP